MKKLDLKKLIHQLILEEAGKIGPSKAYMKKEELMQIIQSALRSRADLIENQEEYQAVIDEEIEKLRRDIDMTLDMIARSLYQVPFQAFKRK